MNFSLSVLFSGVIFVFALWLAGRRRKKRIDTEWNNEADRRMREIIKTRSEKMIQSGEVRVRAQNSESTAHRS